MKATRAAGSAPKDSDSSTCSTCLKPHATFKCGICEASLCKSCAQFVDEDMLAYLQKVPKELTYGAYCSSCFEEKVAPVRTEFDAILERAKDVAIYYKAQSKETRAYRRKEKPLLVENCDDRDETILRLAFLAAKAGFDMVIDVDLHAKKVITDGYQTSLWSGTGIPIKT